MTPNAQLIEAESDWLYHGTRCKLLSSIARQGRLLSQGTQKDYVSFSESLYSADIFGREGAVLVFRHSAMTDRVMRVEYSRAWAANHKSHARYVANIPSGVRLDVRDFLELSSEHEWISKRKGSMSFEAGELVSVLVDTTACDLADIRKLFASYLSPFYVVDKTKGMKLLRASPTVKDTQPIPTRDQLRTIRPATARVRKLVASRQNVPQGVLIERPVTEDMHRAEVEKYIVKLRNNPIYKNAKLVKWRGANKPTGFNRTVIALGVGRDVWMAPDLIIHVEVMEALIAQRLATYKDALDGIHYFVTDDGSLKLS